LVDFHSHHFELEKWFYSRFFIITRAQSREVGIEFFKIDLSRLETDEKDLFYLLLLSSLFSCLKIIWAIFRELGSWLLGNWYQRCCKVLGQAGNFFGIDISFPLAEEGIPSFRTNQEKVRSPNSPGWNPIASIMGLLIVEDGYWPGLRSGLVLVLPRSSTGGVVWNWFPPYSCYTGRGKFHKFELYHSSFPFLRSSSNVSRTSVNEIEMVSSFWF